MLKKTVKFTDFNGKPQTKDLYFNISKTEIAEMDMNESQMAQDGQITGGIKEKLDTIRKGGKGREILQSFKDIIFMAYGEKSEDGQYFYKSADKSYKFASSPAYDAFFTELLTDPAKAAETIKAMLPDDLDGSKDQDKPVGPPPMSPAQRQQEAASAPVPAADIPTQPAVPADPTPEVTPTKEQMEAFLAQQRQQESGDFTQGS